MQTIVLAAAAANWLSGTRFLAASSSGDALGSLGINGWWLLTYAVNIAIVFWILRRFAIPPMLGMLEKRENLIRQSVEQTHEIEQRLAETRQECAAELDKARVEGQNVVAQATKAADRIRDDLVTQARSESAKIVERARAQIGQETDQAILQLRREAADLAILAASRVVGASLDQPAQRKLVSEFIEEAGKQN